MRKTIVVLAMLALVVPALADFVAETAKPMGGQVASNRGTVVYDNTVNGPTGAFAQAPGAWIGDELILTQAGILEDVAFSIYNSSAAGNGPLGMVDVDLLFFDSSNGTYVGGVTFAALDMFVVAGGDLLPGYFTTVYADGLAGLGIALPQNLLAVQVLYNPLGGSTALGTIMANPPVVGSSTDDFYLDNTVATPPGTNAGWYWFNGNPIANFYWGISIPEPASFGLLALGALAMLRRR